MLHAGVRLIGKVPYFGALTSLFAPFLELELFHGYNPNKKVLNQEAELIHGLGPLLLGLLSPRWINSSCSMATSAIHGLARVDSGSRRSKKVLASLFPSRSSSVAPSLVKS
jgi:hypothetical protein